MITFRISSQFQEIIGYDASLFLILYRASFLTKTMHVEGRSFKFQIWDTAGQEKVSMLTLVLLG